MPVYNTETGIPIVNDLGQPMDGCCCGDGNSRYIRIYDCCTGEVTNKVIQKGCTALLFRIAENCYFRVPGSEGEGMLRSEAVSLGYEILDCDNAVTINNESTPFEDIVTCSDAAECNKFMILGRKICFGGDHPGVVEGYFGPISIPTKYRTAAEYEAAVLGKYFYRGDSLWYVAAVLSVPYCIWDWWYDNNKDLILGSDTGPLIDPFRACCLAQWLGNDLKADKECDAPCCLFVDLSGFHCSFCSETGTPLNGYLVRTWESGSIGDYTTGDDTIIGGSCKGSGNLIPSTSCAAIPRIYWRADIASWWLEIVSTTDFGEHWRGQGGSNPCDPSGMYSFVATTALSSPGCSQLNHGNPQEGFGPSSLLVVRS